MSVQEDVQGSGEQGDLTLKNESVESGKADNIDIEAVCENPGIAGEGQENERGSESGTTEDADACFAGEQSAGVFGIEVLDAGMRVKFRMPEDTEFYEPCKMLKML